MHGFSGWYQAFQEHGYRVTFVHRASGFGLWRGFTYLVMLAQSGFPMWVPFLVSRTGAFFLRKKAL